jgi:hypothetical protein
MDGPFDDQSAPLFALSNYSGHPASIQSTMRAISFGDTGFMPAGIRVIVPLGVPISEPNGASPRNALTRLERSPLPGITTVLPKTRFATNWSRVMPRQNAPCSPISTFPMASSNSFWISANFTTVPEVREHDIRIPTCARLSKPCIAPPAKPSIWSHHFGPIGLGGRRRRRQNGHSGQRASAA